MAFIYLPPKDIDPGSELDVAANKLLAAIREYHDYLKRHHPERVAGVITLKNKNEVVIYSRMGRYSEQLLDFIKELKDQDAPASTNEGRKMAAALFPLNEVKDTIRKTLGLECIVERSSNSTKTEIYLYPNKRICPNLYVVVEVDYATLKQFETLKPLLQKAYEKLRQAKI